MVIFQRKKSVSGRTPVVEYAFSVVEARRELVDHLGERVLRRRALLDRQAPPAGSTRKKV